MQPTPPKSAVRDRAHSPVAQIRGAGQDGRRLRPKMDRVSRFFGSLPGIGSGGAPDSPAVDSAEKVQISSLALLKMLKHGEIRKWPINYISAMQVVPVCQWK